MAGILDALLGAENPFAKFVDSHQNAIGALGAGLARGPDLGSGFANAAALVPQARQLDRQQAQALQTKNATLQLLKTKYPELASMVESGAITPVQAASEMFKRQAAAQKGQVLSPGDTLYQGGEAVFTAPGGAASATETPGGRQQLADQYGLTGTERQTYILTGKLPGGNQSLRAGVGQPIYGRNRKTGDYVPFEPMTNGTLINTVDPSVPASDFEFDPYFASAQRTGGTVDAKTAAQARAALPAAQQALAITNKAIADIRGNPTGEAQQFGNILGFPTRLLPPYPGSSMANFRTALSQAQGQAFLQARQMLKGGGQITDFEGAKAEAAFSRMKLAADQGDQPAFDQALADFQQAVQGGYAKLLEAAQGGYAAGPVPALGGTHPQAPAQGASDPLGIR